VRELLDQAEHSKLLYPGSDFIIYMTHEKKLYHSALGAVLLMALALLGAISFLAPSVPVAHADSYVSACEYSSNGNSYALAEQNYESSSYFTYHESSIKQYVNSNGFAKAIDEGGGDEWFDYFTPTTLVYTEGPNAYGFSQTVDTYTNDGTQSGYQGAGYVFVQIYNGVAYPTCKYNIPATPALPALPTLP
jgi:hypothetical protein